jgi:hypothetical protein
VPADTSHRSGLGPNIWSTTREGWIDSEPATIGQVGSETTTLTASIVAAAGTGVSASRQFVPEGREVIDFCARDIGGQVGSEATTLTTSIVAAAGTGVPACLNNTNGTGNECCWILTHQGALGSAVKVLDIVKDRFWGKDQFVKESGVGLCFLDQTLEYISVHLKTP